MEDPPGVPESRGLLGSPPGSSGTLELPTPNLGPPIGGRVGPSVSRAPVGALNPPGRPTGREGAADFRITPVEPAPIPAYGAPDVEEAPTFLGPESGLTLDSAIDLLIRRNLSLIALRLEVPMADADILTASLRANPIVYADAQLVPYGRYWTGRPGGQTQYDVNVTYPIDVTRKRRARTRVAEQAKRVTEAQLQDAVRLQIDNLYTAFVDVAEAAQTVQYSEQYVQGLTRRHRLSQTRHQAGTLELAAVESIRAQLEQAQLQLREAREGLVTKTLALAVLLDLPRAEAETLQVRDLGRDTRELNESDEALIKRALTTRPDLIAYRLGVQRSQADVALARANRYSDVYLLYQPYTFQDNRPLGLKSATSWALGVTATLPIYNRNQGNVQRARINVRQTQIELSLLERQIAHEVEVVLREFRLSRISILEYEREVIPASRAVLERAQRRFDVSEAAPEEYLEAQRDFNEVFRLYRAALLRHRRSMLDLNTAVGARILP